MTPEGGKYVLKNVFRNVLSITIIYQNKTLFYETSLCLKNLCHIINVVYNSYFLFVYLQNSFLQPFKFYN